MINHKEWNFNKKANYLVSALLKSLDYLFYYISKFLTAEEYFMTYSFKLIIFNGFAQSWCYKIEVTQNLPFSLLCFIADNERLIEKEVFLHYNLKKNQVCLHRIEFQFFVTFTTNHVVNRHVARTRSQMFHKKSCPEKSGKINRKIFTLEPFWRWIWNHQVSVFLIVSAMLFSN